MDLFNSSTSEVYYSSKTTEQLKALDAHLTYQLQVIDGTAPTRYQRNGRPMKPKPVTQMKEAWTEALQIIKTELQKRNIN